MKQYFGPLAIDGKPLTGVKSVKGNFNIDWGVAVPDVLIPATLCFLIPRGRWGQVVIFSSG